MNEAANENERRPFANRISGTVRRNLSRDLKFLVGIFVFVFEFYSGKKTAYKQNSISQSTDINQHAMPEKDAKG